MNHLTSLSISVAMLIAATDVYAEGVHIGYCDGNIYNDMITGQNGQAEVSAAVKITGQMLSDYASCQITSLYIGLSESATQFPETITGWLRNDLSGDNLVSASVSAQAGWLMVTFDTPLNVADYVETGIYAGFSYQQPGKYAILSIGGPKSVADACWIAKGDKWNNQNKYGVLPIEVIVEGENLSQHNLSISDITMPHYGIVPTGQDIKFWATITNHALIPATNPIVRYTTADGVLAGQIDLPMTLAYRDSRNVELSIPTTALASEAEADIDLQLVWSDDSKDEMPEDNQSSIHVSMVEQTALRQMVVEEGTGSWCGFCPRGIVGLRDMKSLYPDRFIGISIHDDDEYTIPAYDQWIRQNYFTTFPNCIINRDGNNYDPEFSILQNHLLSLDTIAEANIEIVNASVVDSTLNVKAEVTFSRSVTDAHYNVAIVVLEDQLPIVQSNYYGGGGYGKMGGFESLGSHCHIEVDDVVRGVFPSPNGDNTLIPGTIQKNEPITIEYMTEMPKYADPSQLSLVVLLINADNREITNGAKSEEIEGLPSANIHTLKTESMSDDQLFDLMGRPAHSGNRHGIFVNRNKSIILL